MRVLFVCNYKPGVGGISGQVEALQKHLRGESFVADVFSTKDSFIKRLFMPFRLKRTIKRYNVVHIHCCSGWGFLPAVFGISAARKGKKRIVLTYHGGGGEAFFNKHKKLVKYFLTRTDTNIVLSGFLGRVFDEHQIPYTIIPNIVEMDKSLFRKREILKPHFICIRSHEEIYNIPCILRAFKQVQESVPNATLTLVGDGSLHNDLLLLTSRMKLSNITFTGRVDNKSIYSYLDKADIMLSSPTVDNMPVSLLEAMNAGLLVISSNVGGVPFMIEDGKNGLLFETDNSDQLASKMLWALNNQDECQRIIRAAKDNTIKYSWEGIKDRIMKSYLC